MADGANLILRTARNETFRSRTDLRRFRSVMILNDHASEPPQREQQRHFKERKSCLASPAVKKISH